MAKDKKNKPKYEKKLMKVPYCKIILRNMEKDETGASFLFQGESITIPPSKEYEVKKAVATHLQNLTVRKSKFEHSPNLGPNQTGEKVYYEDPRFIVQILEEYEKEELVKVRKVKK